MPIIKPNLWPQGNKLGTRGCMTESVGCHIRNRGPSPGQNRLPGRAGIRYRTTGKKEEYQVVNQPTLVSLFMWLKVLQEADLESYIGIYCCPCKEELDKRVGQGKRATRL